MLPGASQSSHLLVLCFLGRLVVHASPAQPTCSAPSAVTGAAEGAAGDHRRGAALLQKESSFQSISAMSKGRKHTVKEVPPHWFNGFYKDESTFDPDGVGENSKNPEYLASQVVNQKKSMLGQWRPEYMGRNGVPEEWFEESVSGGPSASWQTRFPALEDAQNKMPQRVSTDTGIPLLDAKMRKNANWFDDSVTHYDEFGRNKPPTEHSDDYYWDWSEQSWSTPISCGSPGCTANATLPTFDAKKLQHARCKLSFLVHATDYDDEYSRENVEWLEVNNVPLMHFCEPGLRGCNKSVPTAELGMHKCLTDFPIDNLFSKGGTLNIASKISNAVDECPVNNNLLSGEARVTCRLKPWPKRMAAHIPTLSPKTKAATCSTNFTSLRCTNSGCTANTTYKVCAVPEKDQKCILSMKIYHTDFDADLGADEKVEWVRVDGKDIAKNLKPGRNPCKEVYDGKAPTQESIDAQAATTMPPSAQDVPGYRGLSRGMLAKIPDGTPSGASRCQSCRRRLRTLSKDQALSSNFLKSYNTRFENTNFTHLRAAPDDMKMIITSQDVTKQIKQKGQIVVEAKISENVDECGKDGYLLNAQVLVECS